MGWMEDLESLAVAGDAAGFAERMGRVARVQLWEHVDEDDLFDLVVKRVSCSPECLDLYLQETVGDLRNSSFSVEDLRLLLLEKGLDPIRESFGQRDAPGRVALLAACAALGDERIWGLGGPGDWFALAGNGNSLLNVALVYRNAEVFGKLCAMPERKALPADRIEVAFKQALDAEESAWLEQLLEAFARPGIADPGKARFENGAGLLHKAAGRNDESKCEMLLQAGADPNLQDADGMTPFMLAVERNRFLAQDPLRPVTDLLLRNKQGLSAADLARRSAMKEEYAERIAAMAEKQALERGLGQAEARPRKKL